MARTLLSPWVHINELARFWRGVTISYFDDRKDTTSEGTRAVDELSVPLLGKLLFLNSSINASSWKGAFTHLNDLNDY